MSSLMKTEQIAGRTCELYKKGNKCDTAIITVMQERLGLNEKDLWLTYVIYRNLKNQGCPRYCDALWAASAVIYSAVIKRLRSEGDISPEEVYDEYKRRTKELFDDFKIKFGYLDCPSLLGFDVNKIDQYTGDIGDYISSGEWMEKCCDFMKLIVKTLCKDAPRSA